MVKKITVTDYLLERLVQLGVRYVFGVPGDFNLKFLDYIENHPVLEWIGCCNELNASYAADGYARVKQVENSRGMVETVDKEQKSKGSKARTRGGVYGLGVLVTTYGVGELSAANGMAGAFAENVPLLHIVCVPSTQQWKGKPVLHHTLGDGRFDAFIKVAEPLTVAQGHIDEAGTAANVVDEVLREALKHARPTYLTIHTDLVPAEIPRIQLEQPLFPPASLTTVGSDLQPLDKPNDDDLEDWVLDRIEEMWNNASNPTILLDAGCIRFGVQHLARDLIEATGVKWYTAPMAKAALDETHPNFMGVYSGLTSAPGVKEAFETCDFVLTVGTVRSDINSGAFSWKLPINQTVQLQSDHCLIQRGRYERVTFFSILPDLAKRLKGKTPKKALNGGLTNGVGSHDGHANGVLTNGHIGSGAATPNGLMAPDEDGRGRKGSLGRRASWTGKLKRRLSSMSLRERDGPRVTVNGGLASPPATPLTPSSPLGAPSPLIPSSPLPRVNALLPDGEDLITQDALWARMPQFYKEGDIILAETGTSLFGVLGAPFPKNAISICQILWSSIGYTCGAALGCALAAAEAEKELGRPPRRTLLFIGDGSLQLTVQEIATMIRYGLSPILVVLNNDGYSVERAIHGEKAKYNDISLWNWQALLPLFQPKNSKSWKATTMGELDAILSDEEFGSGNNIQLLEIVVGKYDYPLALRTHLSKVPKKK